MSGTKRAKYTAADLPEPGTVFIAPMADGRLCAGRVLRNEVSGGAQAALLTACNWIGDRDPPLTDSRLRQTTARTHHGWKGELNAFWTWDPMPAEFRAIGKVELSEVDRQITSNSYTGWQAVPLHVFTQWRWDNDRSALLAEESRKEAEEAERQRVAAQRRAAYMRALTLDSLAERKWFTGGDEGDASTQLEKVRDIIERLIAGIRALPKPTQANVQKRFRQAIKELNSVDAAGSGIMTIEREDICEALEQVACAAKFPVQANQIDQLREW